MSYKVRPTTGLPVPSLAIRGGGAMQVDLLANRPIPVLTTFAGTATAMTAVDPVGSGAYFNGQSFWATFAQTNGAAATLNISDGVTSYGAFALSDEKLVALPAAFIDTAQRYLLRVSISGSKIMVLGAAEAIARAAAIDDAVAGKADIASPLFTGNPRGPTPSGGDNDTSLATTAFVQGELVAKADIASPLFTGNPRGPTPSGGDNDTSLATTAFVQTAIAAVVNASPATLDTLKELADALGDDANFAATMTTALGLKAPIASPLFTGNPRGPTPSGGDNDTSLATTAFVQGEMAAIELVTDEFDASGSYQYAVADVAESGQAFAGVLLDGTEIVAWDRQLVARDAANKAYAEKVRADGLTGFAKLDCDYNVGLEEGQSLSEGVEGHPAKSIVNVDDNKMWGGSYRTTTDNAVYTPFGGGALNDLVAIVSGSGGAPMTELEQAALTAGAAVLGEPPGIAMTNLFKQLTNSWHRLRADPDHIAIYGTVARGAKSADELRPGHTQGSVEWYARFTSLMGQLKTEIVTNQSKTLQLIFITRIQGENESLSVALSTNATEYEAVLKIDHEAKLAWCAANLPHQTLPPIHFYVIPGDTYAQDFDPEGNFEQIAPMAIWRFCEKTKGCFVVGPYFPYTSHSRAHRNVNGYRWLGVMQGLIADRIINQGRGFKPLFPITIRTIDAVSEIDFHVPVPPLKVGTTSYGLLRLAAESFPTWGFKARDLGGYLTVTPVQVADTIIRLYFNRVPVGPGAISYAGSSTDGQGLIQDSNDADPRLNYVYTLGSGDETGVNIAELVDKRYPTNHWMPAWTLPFNWSAF